MFHWICPECGREIPPSERECQVCDPKAAVSIVEPPAPEVIEAAPVAPPVVAETVPVIPETKPEPPASIKLHEVPDPLLALAEEIRAVQAARAASLAAPHEATGLLELAEAVKATKPEPPPAAAAAPVASEKPAPVEHP